MAGCCGAHANIRPPRAAPAGARTKRPARAPPCGLQEKIGAGQQTAGKGRRGKEAKPRQWAGPENQGNHQLDVTAADHVAGMEQEQDGKEHQGECDTQAKRSRPCNESEQDAKQGKQN